MTINKHVLLLCMAVMSILCALTSCNKGVVYDQYNHTPLYGWEKNDTLVFDVSPLAQGGHYRQEIGLRTNETFPFKSLSLVVEQTIEPNHRTYIDTLKCKLADDKGNMLGQGISYYQYNFILVDRDLSKGDSLHVTVRHIMKREILPGISDIGFRMYAD